MTRILTVICSAAQDSLDAAVALASRLIQRDILITFASGEVFRPLSVDGEDAIEVLCKIGRWRSARQAFKEAGYGLVGDE